MWWASSYTYKFLAVYLHLHHDTSNVPKLPLSLLITPAIASTLHWRRTSPSLVGRPSFPLRKYLKWQVGLFSCLSAGRNRRDRHSSTGEPEECRGLRTRCRSVFKKCLQWFIFPEPVFHCTNRDIHVTPLQIRGTCIKLSFYVILLHQQNVFDSNT